MLYFELLYSLLLLKINSSVIKVSQIIYVSECDEKQLNTIHECAIQSIRHIYPWIIINSICSNSYASVLMSGSKDTGIN